MSYMITVILIYIEQPGENYSYIQSVLYYLFDSELNLLSCFVRCLDYIRCMSNPCENGGTCQATEDTYGCKCLPNFHGPLCESNHLHLCCFTIILIVINYISGGSYIDIFYGIQCNTLWHIRLVNKHDGHYGSAVTPRFAFPEARQTSEGMQRS